MAKGLLEGFADGAANGIRQWFARSPEAQAAEIMRGGAPSVERAGLPFNLVSQFGYDSLAEHLRIDQDLQARYTDYEEMDEYGEINCLSGDLQIPNLTVLGNKKESMSGKTVSLKGLSESFECGDVTKFFVYAVDHRAAKVVVAEAKGIRKTGRQQAVYRLVYEDYRRTRSWEVKATKEHLLMLRDGSYCALEDLRPGNRLMPCTLSIAKNGYLTVYEPLRARKGGKSIHTAVHPLVGQAVAGRELEPNEVVHHKDHDKANPHPENLEIKSRADHALGHINASEDVIRRSAISSTVANKWLDSDFKKSVSRSHQKENPKWLDSEMGGKHKRYESHGKLSDEHRSAIARGRTIDLAPDVVEAAVRGSASFNDAAKKLGVSWNTLMRRLLRFGIGRELLGTNLGGPQPGEVGYGNHRVVSVEFAGYEDVYDIEVPGYHNFAVGDPDGEGLIFVHNSAYDIYADDSAMPDMERGQSVWVTSENKGVEKELNDVLHKRLLIEDDIWGLERTIAKYGNAYGELLVNQQGLIGINFLPPPTVRRVEGPRGELLGFVQDVRGEFNLSMEDFYKLAAERGQNSERTRPLGESTVFEDWEVVHWRLRGKHLRSVYGHGVGDAARWIWKRLSLLEDALLIYKLSRAPARYAFYVDIGDYDMERGLAYVNRVKNQFVKKKFVNPNTGKLDMRHNPLAHDEDFFVPSKGGKDSTRIEVLQGPDYAETDTVEYHRDKLVSALKVPKTYMGYGGEATKGSLSSEDIRFARTVMRLQRETRGGMRKACRVHLIARGADVNRFDYDVNMSVPSAIMELAKLEVMSATADLAARTQEILPLQWALQSLFHMSEQEALELMDLKDKETVRKAKVEAKVAKMMAKAEADAQPQEGEGTQVQVPANAPVGDEEEEEEGAEEEGAEEEEGDEEAAAAAADDADADAADKKKAKKKKAKAKDKVAAKKKKQQQSRGVPRGQMLMMERRLQRILESQHKATERMMDGKLKDMSAINERVNKVISSDPGMRRRLRQVRNLLGEVSQRE